MLYCCMQVFLEFWERSMRRKLRRHVWNLCVCIFAKAIFHVFVQESFFFQVHSYNHHRSSPGSEHGSCLCFQVFLNCSYSHLLCCRLAVLHIHFGDGRCHVRQNTARNFTLLQSYWVRYVARHNWHQSGFSTSELALQASSHGSCMMNQDWKVMPAWCFCHLRPSIMDSVQSDLPTFDLMNGAVIMDLMFVAMPLPCYVIKGQHDRPGWQMGVDPQWAADCDRHRKVVVSPSLPWMDEQVAIGGAATRELQW